MLDARSEPRDRCEIEATVIAGAVTLPCLVENLSENGAKLALGDDVDLPPVFELRLPVFDDLSETRVVERRWRMGRCFGVRFLDSLALVR